MSDQQMSSKIMRNFTSVPVKNSPPLQSMEETDLLLAVRQGHSAAMTELVERNIAAVSRVAKAMLGNTPEAEDVVQETFIRFWSHLNSYRHEAKISTFLTRITINLAINESRRHQKRQAVERPLDGMTLNPQRFPQTVQNTPGDDAEHLHTALQELEESQRAVVALRLLQGYSTKETAQILDIPLGTVLSRLSRALDKLKIILTKYDNV